MKQFSVIALALGIAASGSWCNAASRRDSVIDRRILKDCDPVCELQAQDQAFGMLIEAYREFQSYQIETDFQSRLRAAAGLNEHNSGSLIIDTKSQSLQTLRGWVEELARKERDLRMEQMQTRVVNFHSAYTCARRVDEQDVGGSVVNKLDTRRAAAQLRTYKIIALGSATAKVRTVQSIPATTIFVDAAPIEITSEKLIAPCE